MKNFNKMTEATMSNTQGGSIALVVAAIAAAVAGTGTGVGFALK